MATKCYIELRKSTTRGTESITADVMRHLHTRQHLGKAVIICDQPIITLSAARKQWLKLSRALQKRRASTLNADKILKYTHAITRMQHMYFTAKSPALSPDADIYFLTPEFIDTMPVHCWSVYLLTEVETLTAKRLVEQLPAEALIINYQTSGTWQELHLQPKRVLEVHVSHQWRQVMRFLASHHIDVSNLIIDSIHNVDAMDDALDTLLGISHAFLQIAHEFQRTLELARPLRLPKEQRTAYDSLVLLAHRVQALTPGAFGTQFLETYNEDDTFFLYDVRRRFATGNETLAEALARHRQAGRLHLARSLQLLAETTKQ
jgi:hypothetical protein